MNERAERIKAEYMGMCSSLVNQYIQLSKQYPPDALYRYRKMCKKYMMLVDMWAWIEMQQKEKKHG